MGEQKCFASYDSWFFYFGIVIIPELRIDFFVN